MPHYIVRKIYKTVVEVEVFAEDDSDAQEKAIDRDGHEVDCWLIDMDVEEQEE